MNEVRTLKAASTSVEHLVIRGVGNVVGIEVSFKFPLAGEADPLEGRRVAKSAMTMGVEDFGELTCSARPLD
jgi:hypothetical protein